MRSWEGTGRTHFWLWGQRVVRVAEGGRDCDVSLQDGEAARAGGQRNFMGDWGVGELSGW